MSGERWYLRTPGPTGWLYRTPSGQWTAMRLLAQAHHALVDARTARQAAGLAHAVEIVRVGPPRVTALSTAMAERDEAVRELSEVRRAIERIRAGVRS